MITTLGICAAYLAAGSIVWRKLVIQPHHGSQFAWCENNGGINLGEDIAFLLAKGTFMVVWPIWLIVFIACRILQSS